MAKNNGIFIRSTKSLDDIIEECKNLIRNSDSDGSIETVFEEKTYGGMKVFFKGDGIVQELIGKHCFFGTDDMCAIHPLITHLTVYDAIVVPKEEEFITELRNIIQKALGPVLKVYKVPASKLHPDIGSGRWRVLLNVPEVEDLDVYKRNGLPHELTIEVPGLHGKLPITFHCTKCEKDGHTQSSCVESIGDGKKSISHSVKYSTVGTLKSKFCIQDHEESRESDITAKNRPVLNRKNIREFESEIGKEEVRNYCDSAHLKDSCDIKVEALETLSSYRNMEKKRPLCSEKDLNTKKARISSMVDDDSQSENLPKASSTTNDADSVEVIYESPPSTLLKIQPHPLSQPSIRGFLTRNSVDDFVSTSNQPAPTIDTVKSELPSTDENESDSNHGISVSKPVRQRKKPVQSTIVIPDRIKNIISEIGGVLNVEQLTAFFNHVKKKSRPCSFAEMYTRDVAGLKKQLEEIKRKYYMIPERGTNVEIQFMKWFVNILDRFDGTPSTRKKKTPT